MKIITPIAGVLMLGLALDCTQLVAQEAPPSPPAQQPVAPPQNPPYPVQPGQPPYTPPPTNAAPNQ